MQQKPLSTHRGKTDRQSNSQTIPVSGETADSSFSSLVDPSGGGNLSGASSRTLTFLETEAYEFAGIRAAFAGRQTDGTHHVKENPAYTLILDGHLYLDDSTTIDTEENLALLLHRMSVTSPEKGLASIAGGMFNLMVIDKRNLRMFVCGDSLGYQPLYFREDQKGFHISGNQFAFQEQTAVAETAVVEFLRYGYLPFSPSFFEGVDRLLPGQTLNVFLTSQTAFRSAPQVFAFKPLNHRSKDIAVAAGWFNEKLEGLFSRCSGMWVRLNQRAHPASVIIAGGLRKAGAELSVNRFRRDEKTGRKTTGFPSLQEYPLPPDLLMRLFSHLRSGLRIPVSIEWIPADVLPGSGDDNQPPFYADIFGADWAMGVFSHPLPGLPPRLRQAAALLRNRQVESSPIRSIGEYQELLYQQPGALGEQHLEGILSLEAECWMRNQARGILEIIRESGHDHQDFVQMINYYTESRSRGASLAQAAAGKTGAVFPFLDYQIMEAGSSFRRSIKSLENFYRFYIRRYFPDLAQEPWGPFHLCAADGRRSYRFKRFAGMLKGAGHKLSASHRDLALSGGGAVDELRRVAERVFRAPHPQIPSFITEAVMRLHHQHRLHPLLMARLVSLHFYLGGSLC